MGSIALPWCWYVISEDQHISEECCVLGNGAVIAIYRFVIIEVGWKIGGHVARRRRLIGGNWVEDDWQTRVNKLEIENNIVAIKNSFTLLGFEPSSRSHAEKMFAEVWFIAQDNLIPRTMCGMLILINRIEDKVATALESSFSGKIFTDRKSRLSYKISFLWRGEERAQHPSKTNCFRWLRMQDVWLLAIETIRKTFVC